MYTNTLLHFSIRKKDNVLKSACIFRNMARKWREVKMLRVGNEPEKQAVVRMASVPPAWRRLTGIWEQWFSTLAEELENGWRLGHPQTYEEKLSGGGIQALVNWVDTARHRHSGVHRGRGELGGWERSHEGVGGVTDGMLGRNVADEGEGKGHFSQRGQYRKVYLEEGGCELGTRTRCREEMKMVRLMTVRFIYFKIFLPLTPMASYAVECDTFPFPVLGGRGIHQLCVWLLSYYWFSNFIVPVFSYMDPVVSSHWPMLIGYNLLY